MANWRSDDGRLALEAPDALLEALRAEASYAMNGVGRGGVEVGGLLLGQRDGRSIEVRDWRPMRCDHSRGASFLLSERDVAALSSQLDGVSMEHAASGNSVVGWWVSHTRGEAGVREEEGILHSRLMPDGADVLMVMKPSQFGDVEATLYEIRGERATELPGVLHLEPKPGLHWQPPTSASVAANDAPAEPVQRRPWAAIAGLAAIAAVSGWMGWDLWQRLQPAAVPVSGPSTGEAAKSEAGRARPALVVERPVEILSLHVMRQGTKLQILWDAESGAVAGAPGGALSVYDQGEVFRRNLTAEELRLGAIDYTRETRGITVDLVVTGRDGEKRAERATFPAPPAVGE